MVIKPTQLPRLPWLPKLRRAFPQAGIFLVGGLVRDLLLHRSSKDIDLVVTNVPLPQLQKFLQSIGRVNLVGKTFGVLKFNYRDHPSVDIALPRTEVAGGSGRYRDVAAHFAAHLPLEKDLARRDFTINALAYDLRRHCLLDPFSGQKDLRAKIIRAVGKPAERFQEDYTRLLRALRFACQLNFTLEPATARALKKALPHLHDTVQGERKVPLELIGREFMKALVADPVRFLDLWDEYGVYKKLVPELLLMHGCAQPTNYHTEGDVWAHTRLALQNLHGPAYQKFRRALPRIFAAPPSASATAYLATLLHDIAKPLTIQTPQKHGVDRIRFTGHDTLGAKVATTIATRLRLSATEGLSVDTELVAWLIEHHLLAVHAPVSTLKETTLEKYFLRDPVRGRELLTLLFADGAATVPSKKSVPDAMHLTDILQRLKKLLRTKKGHATVVAPLVNGHDIMRHLKIAPGPRVGQLLEEVREAQLTHRLKTKTQALKFLRSRV